MQPKFVEVDRETLYLLPPSLQDWLPAGHLARFVVEIVEQLDLCSLKASYAGRGSQPYNPEMLVALLFYGYATGVFSVENWNATPMTPSRSVTSRQTAIRIMIPLPLSGGAFCHNLTSCLPRYC